MGHHRSIQIDLIIAAEMEEEILLVVVAEAAMVPSIRDSNNGGTIAEVEVGKEAMAEEAHNSVVEAVDTVAVAAVECLFYNFLR